jgi:hypothetical protein
MQIEYAAAAGAPFSCKLSAPLKPEHHFVWKFVPGFGGSTILMQSEHAA